MAQSAVLARASGVPCAVGAARGPEVAALRWTGEGATQWPIPAAHGVSLSLRRRPLRRRWIAEARNCMRASGIAGPDREGQGTTAGAGRAEGETGAGAASEDRGQLIGASGGARESEGREAAPQSEGQDQGAASTMGPTALLAPLAALLLSVACAHQASALNVESASKKAGPSAKVAATKRARAAGQLPAGQTASATSTAAQAAPADAGAGAEGSAGSRGKEAQGGAKRASGKSQGKAASARQSQGSAAQPQRQGADSMAVAERQQWVQGLPVVTETIAYTDVLELKAQRNVKHIIKLPDSVFQAQPETALAVLGDERVVRVVLPPLERDPKFWRAWRDQKLDDLVIDAFSPPVEPAQMLPWGQWGPSLTFLERIGLVRTGPQEKRSSGKAGTGKAKQATQKGTKGGKGTAGGKAMSAKEKAQAAALERVQKLEAARKAAERERREHERQVRQQMEERRRAEREEKRKWERELREAKGKEEKLRKTALAQQKRLAQLASQSASAGRMGNVWKSAAENEGVRFLMGVGFFFVFYYGVILGIKKRKKDYEDRVKLQKAAEEERRKMENWEDEMAELEALEAEEEERKQEKATGEGGGEGEEADEDAELRKREEESETMKAALRFMRSGAKVKRARRGKRGRRPTYLDLSDEVKFDDVAGLGEIRRELEEVVDFFQSAEKYRRRGSKIPTGILLCGEPGCGKTLLAKAVAGEAGVNFFSVSASQFVEIFVGVGASRVRALYNEARENAPAVVFIDELDAVGRQRGLTEGSGGQERDATLNQLLTCLDGFEGRGDVITIAATNRPDILDSALVRPGRFDRKIFIPKPSMRGRAQILQVHSRNKVMAEDVDYDVVAEITDGMSGAELANVVDVAALKVLREGRTEITTDDLLEAAVLEEGGYPRQHPISARRQLQLALNEAAQAVVAYNFAHFRNIQLITVTPPLTEEKGEIRYKMDSALFKANLLSARVLKDYVTVQLAPMVADQLWNPADEWCTIWADHTDLARKMARQVAINGLTPAAEGAMAYSWSTTGIKDPAQAEGIDADAAAILAECRAKAQKILLRNRGLVDSLVERLIDVKTLQREEFSTLVELYGSFDPEAPSLMERRNQQVSQIRESFMAKKALS